MTAEVTTRELARTSTLRLMGYDTALGATPEEEVGNVVPTATNLLGPVTLSQSDGTLILSAGGVRLAQIDIRELLAAAGVIYTS